MHYNRHLSSVRALVVTAVLYASLVGVSHAAEIVGRVVKVSDGDTITVLDGSKAQHRVRLLGVDAPEKGQDFGEVSRRELAALVAGGEVTVVWHKRDRYGRILGVVYANGIDAGLVQIKRGNAWHYKTYERDQSPNERRLYANAERDARAARIGLWSQPTQTPPWDWRRNH
jgi:endonuclease YncB( thermonuclease family)